jgi:ribosomal protein S18 acetylase RimI-like enzyme
MSLINELDKIKRLIYENYTPNNFDLSGDINSLDGLNIKLNNGENYIGHSNLVDFGHAWDLDWDILLLYDDYEDLCKSNFDQDFFNKKNSAFLFDLKVFDDYRGKGYGENLLQKCHEIAKDNGFSYCLLITDMDNHIAKNLYTKNNYKVHLQNDKKVFFYKEL